MVLRRRHAQERRRHAGGAGPGVLEHGHPVAVRDEGGVAALAPADGPMLAYVLRRLAATIPVMLIVAVLVFLMLRLTPSDPAAIIAGDNANSEQVAEIRKRLGLDQPILTQFVIWMGKTLQGDFGESFFFKKQVTELILDRLEPTVSLAVFTIVLAVLIASPLGVLAAYRHGGRLDLIALGV